MEITGDFWKLDGSVIKKLTENQTPESKTLEYKSQLPDRTEQGKHRFLASISSFANASGGYLIFGVAENKTGTGKRYKIANLKLEDPDKEILRLQGLLDNNITPRIPAFQIRCIDISEKASAIIIKIPSSWESPHMLKSGKFYSRSSAGKTQLDVQEIRASFLQSEGLNSKIKNFRTDRLSKIISGDTPVLLDGESKLILHLIPIQSFTSREQLTFRNRESFPNNTIPAPIQASGWSHRINLDGFVTFSGSEGKEYTYLQIFRNGSIEAVDTVSLEHKSFPVYWIQELLLKEVKKFLEIQQHFEIEPPIFISLSLINVKGKTINDSPISFRSSYPVDKENIIIPEVMLEDYEEDLTKLLKPIFDVIAHAVGLSQSPYYDEDGNYIPE